VNASTKRGESPGDYVRALVCHYPRSVRETRLLLMLKAYIDDSRMGQPHLYVLGGWVAPVETWTRFSDAWDAILRMSPRIEYFKFSEAMNFTGQFHGMSEQSRNEKLSLLVEAIAEHDLLGISVSIPHEIFHPLFGRHSDPKISNPYVLAFYALIGRLVLHYDSEGLRERIEFVFDYQPTSNSMEQAREGWEIFLGSVPAHWRELLPNHPPSFLDDKEVIGLQAADLHAGWVRAMNEADLLGLPQPPAIWGEERGNAIRRLYRYMTPETAEQIFEALFGFKPTRISGSLVPVWRVSWDSSGGQSS
jgi:hypothetical protein